MVVRLVTDPADQAVSAMWSEWGSRRQPIAAPALLPYEVTNALYRYQKLGYMTSESVELLLKAALALPVQLYGDVGVHERARCVAGRVSLSAG